MLEDWLSPSLYSIKHNIYIVILYYNSMIGIETVRKKKKTAISVTVDSLNLEYIEENVIKPNKKEVTLSSIIDSLLIQFVRDIKKSEEWD